MTKSSPKLSFAFNKEKDLYNLWETCNVTHLRNNKTPLNQKFIDQWGGREYGDCRTEIEKHFKMLYDSGLVELFMESAEKGWNSINDKYFKRLEEVTQRPVYTGDFKANITTSGRCLCNPSDNSFLLSIRRPYLHALRVCGHELLHLQFSNYFWDNTSKEIGDAKTLILSESLTTLLNSDFRDLWMAEDSGYIAHADLRKFINLEWSKERDFGYIVEKGIEYLSDS